MKRIIIAILLIGFSFSESFTQGCVDARNLRYQYHVTVNPGRTFIISNSYLNGLRKPATILINNRTKLEGRVSIVANLDDVKVIAYCNTFEITRSALDGGSLVQTWANEFYISGPLKIINNSEFYVYDNLNGAFTSYINGSLRDTGPYQSESIQVLKNSKFNVQCNGNLNVDGLIQVGENANWVDSYANEYWNPFDYSMMYIRATKVVVNSAASKKTRFFRGSRSYMGFYSTTGGSAITYNGERRQFQAPPYPFEDEHFFVSDVLNAEKYGQDGLYTTFEIKASPNSARFGVVLQNIHLGLSNSGPSIGARANLYDIGTYEVGVDLTGRESAVYDDINSACYAYGMYNKNPYPWTRVKSTFQYYHCNKLPELEHCNNNNLGHFEHYCNRSLSCSDFNNFTNQNPSPPPVAKNKNGKRTESAELITWDPFQDFYGPNSIIKAFKVAPNPAMEKFQIIYALAQSQNVKISISDLKGKVVHTEDLGNKREGGHSFSFNAKKLNLVNGIYLVNLIGNDWVKSKRLVVTP